MKELLLALFGEYEPFVYESTETLYNAAGEAVGTSVSNSVLPDFVWLAGVCGFFLILFCLMRFLYNVIGGRH